MREETEKKREAPADAKKSASFATISAALDVLDFFMKGAFGAAWEGVHKEFIDDFCAKLKAVSNTQSKNKAPIVTAILLETAEAHDTVAVAALLDIWRQVGNSKEGEQFSQALFSATSK